MSIAAVSSNLINQQSPGYFQQRRSDLQQLRQDLQSGNLTAAQQDFNSIQTLGQSGPFGGDAFAVSARQQDFAAIGQALQSGDLTGAQQALGQLQSTFDTGHYGAPPPTSAGSGTSGTSASGNEIVLNLGNATPGEQVTIGFSGSSSSSGEQLTVSVAQPNQTPEQVVLNLGQNGPQELVLNLVNSPSATGTAQSGLSVSA